MKTTTISDDKPQLDKFKDAARELECDDDEQRFKDRLKDVAKAKPKGAEEADG